MVVLDRFSGGNDPEGWILQAEQYFTCLGFSQKDWLPLPYFYLDGEALTWFTWLHRNKQFFDWKHFTKKLLMRFPQRTFTASVSMEDTSQAYIDYIRYATFVPLATSASAVVALSHVTNSSDLEDAFTNGNTEASHMLAKLPEKYSNVDSLALLTGINPEIATLEGLETPQIENTKSVEADLVQEPSSIIEGQVFDEISHSTMSSEIPELNYSFCEDVSMQTKVLTVVLNDLKGSNSVEEENSLDTTALFDKTAKIIALFDKTPKKDASGSLAPFAKQPVMSNTQITGMLCPIATWVSLLFPLVGQEAMMSNEYLELDMLMSIPLSDTITYNLVNHENISFNRHGNDAKEEWNEKGMAAPISHPCELLPTKMTKVSYVATNSASTSLGDTIRCIVLLDTSHISTPLCHVNQQLSKNDATMFIILQAAAQVALLLLTNLTVPGYTHAYSNLEDKVLIGVGSIVRNGPRPVIAKQPNTILKGYVWDPG